MPVVEASWARQGIKEHRRIFFKEFFKVPQPVKFTPATSQLRIAVGRVSGKHTELKLSPMVTIHFWEGAPIAVVSGEALWHHAERKPAVTKLLNELRPDLPHINCSAHEFDYSVGAALSSAGLPLTRLQDGGK